jgi:hypothetical protein
MRLFSAERLASMPRWLPREDKGMASAKELREHAAEFLKLAHSARGEGRACLLAMAKLWTQDAEDIERRGAKRHEGGTGEPASSPKMTGEERSI